MKLTSAAILGAALLTSAPGTPAPGSGRDGRELVEAAEQAMSEGRFREALDLYDHAGTLWPEKAAIPYNMGVAAYRQGDLARAAELFDQARLLAEDPSLRARSAYNLGTTAARSALESQEQDAAIARTRMKDATESLKSSLDHFRQAIEADPTDGDARANGELAWRWLQKLQEQMEQQGQQQQDSSQDPNENEDQQSQDQQSSQGGQQDQDQPPPDPDPDQNQNQPQQQDQPQPSPIRDEQQQQQGAQDEQQQEQQPAAQQQQQSQQDERPDSTERKPMSREEADRLLQSVRDKEARRREELARQEASRRRPVDKDW